MHRLRTVPGGWNPGEEGVIAIEQSPGDVVFLSAGDTDLSSMVRAWKRLREELGADAVPSLRVASLLMMGQELTIDNYLAEVVESSKLVLARLLGGVDYYSYLVEQLEEVCRERGIPLILLPAYDEPDPELLERSQGVSVEDYAYLNRCFNLAGADNLRCVLVRLFNRYFERKLLEHEPETIPQVLSYRPADVKVGKHRPRVGIIAYRAHLLADNMEPFDALWRALERRGLEPVCVLAQTLRSTTAIDEVMGLLSDKGRRPPVCLINTSSFATKSIKEGVAQSRFSRMDIPVLQAMVASCTRKVWEEGDFGLPPRDIAMNVALPEVDGRIITRAMSFKADYARDEETESDLTRYEAHGEGIEFVAELALRHARLRGKANAEKRVALVMPNYPNKDARLANGVGLDTPESVVEILKAMKGAGYALGEWLPADSETLMNALVERVTNDQDALAMKRCDVRLKESVFRAWLQEKSESLMSLMTERWGSIEEDPFLRKGYWELSGLMLGNTWVAIQPSRGYNLNPAASYHCPDLPPPWYFLAFYCYLEVEFDADAVVHVGKHGNLEWLPGKSLALSENSCFPAAILAPIPHFYPFIVNDPGEGTQAKRRGHAVIIDHLMPPMTRAETYGPLIELEQKMDEFYESGDLDPKRAEYLEKQIRDLLDATNLRVDLGLDAEAGMEELLFGLDGYLCEIKEAQIRDGLHIIGKVPAGDCLVDTLVALHRLSGGDVPGITQALAKDHGWKLDPLDVAPETSLVELGVLVEGCRIAGDVIEWLEQEARDHMIAFLQEGVLPEGSETRRVIEVVRDVTLPSLMACSGEVEALLRGMEGRFVDSGPSGAPTRGRLDVLPTGRNFYSVDLRGIPTRAAWDLGCRSAERVVQRYIQEEGEYPRSLALSVWGTSTMRTGGDDLAQAFALMGVRPVWQGMNQRVVDFEVLSLTELGRPRVDVTLRISGFFRDAFPDAISLFQAAVKKVAEEDEPGDENPLRKAFVDEQQHWKAQGYSEGDAEQRSLYRVFGSKPGAYGAGLQELINNRNWETREDLAQVYMQWGSYAYAGSGKAVTVAPDIFKRRLAGAQVILQNQDNREHDLLDSDDYYQFHGGMANAASVYSGEEKKVYFGDHSRPENPRIKSLKEELLKVYRSRVVNPKWIKGVRRHGYKGAFEMAATVDYLFGYDCGTGMVEDFVYAGLAEAYLLDAENRAFFERYNPWAMKDIAERLLEAVQRGLWKQPDAALLEQIRESMLEAEGAVEDHQAP